ncbi:DUF4332 domain-containing protein [Spiribacter halobius]|uniref:DUF4332 domain-containing protein n=1 Tax=Sediminicurvatus halobius TaxID=2182432 RepID=A0A2U2N8Q8_9GAMM|nr:DUF4332 domain-containing protein [Spiribacter halobius]PWG65462.1 hypothetical protein DEM34_01600 [Spiribacter halobius]UEX76484.1 DUF4332 domain-containing protein [Spiribacter halobius]
MWNDLIRRWLDMAFWWLPGQSTREERPARHDQATPARESREEQRPAQATRPQAARQPKADSAPDAPAESEPAAKPEPAPKPAAASEPEAASKPESAPRPEPAPETTASPGRADDLTEIKGIGAAMQQRLNAHGIRSFADLAAADPYRLLRQLKEDKAVISEARVKEWIQTAQARRDG